MAPLSSAHLTMKVKIPLLTLLLYASLCLEAAPANLDVQLLQATKKGDTNIAQSLVKRGAHVNARDADGATPLMLAAQNSNEPLFTFLLTHGANVHAQDNDGFSALGYGPDFAEALGKRGAKATPKDAAALSDSLENSIWIDSDMEDAMVRTEALLFLRLGMNLNTRGFDEFGTTPLLNAVESRASFVPFLLSHGANPNVARKDGTTPLMAALAFDPLPYANRDGSLARLLISRGARLNERNEFGETALMMAVEGDYGPVIHDLLSHGANPNIRDKRGQTALMRAATGGFIETALLLLRSGADPHLKDAKGQTALNFAQSREFVMSSAGPLRDGGGREAKQREFNRALKGAWKLRPFYNPKQSEQRLNARHVELIQQIFRSLKSEFIWVTPLEFLGELHPFPCRYQASTRFLFLPELDVRRTILL